MGQTDKAIDKYQAALKIRPDFAEARFNLGYVYAGAGLTMDAVNEIQQYLNLHPEASRAREYLDVLRKKHKRLKGDPVLLKGIIPSIDK